MNILILGKDGQVGSELMQRAAGSGVTVHGLDHAELDVTDVTAVQSAVIRMKPDVLINTAAYHQPMECEQHPDEAFWVNTLAVRAMAKLCEEKRIRFFTFSTDYVFDGEKGRPYVETDAPNPLQTYGISKYAGELFARRYNPRSVIIRTSGVYGGKHGSRSKHGNFILSIRKQIIGKKTLDVSSDQMVSTTYASDLSVAVIKLIDEGVSGETVHVVNNGVCSWADMAREIVRLSHSSCRIRPVNRHGISDGINRPLYSALSTDKVTRLGVVMPDWRDALDRYIRTLE